MKSLAETFGVDRESIYRIAARRSWKWLALGLLLFASTAVSAQTHNVVLTISDSVNPAGTTYNLYRGSGACSSSPTLTKIGNATTKSFTDANVAAGTYCYAATAVDSLGDESTKSPTAGAVIPTVPTAVTITVTVQ